MTQDTRTYTHTYRDRDRDREKDNRMLPVSEGCEPCERDCVCVCVCVSVCVCEWVGGLPNVTRECCETRVRIDELVAYG